MRIKLSEKFQNEREDICNKLINILKFVSLFFLVGVILIAKYMNPEGMSVVVMRQR